MEAFEDTAAGQPRIEQAIQKYGWSAEHNAWWYRYCQYDCNPPHRNMFVATEHGALLTTYQERGNYFIISDPLAMPEYRIQISTEFVSWAFSNTSAKKIWFQLERSRRREFLRSLPEGYRARRIYYTLLSPIYDLGEFDPTLQGGHYKTLRKEMHKFHRNHDVTVADMKAYEDRDSLHAIVDAWKMKRPKHERAGTGVYHRMIEDNFQGTDEARVFVVDGKAVGFNAGWKIPNRDRFYGAVGIHDYSVDDLGAMLYLEDLVWLKQRGYHEVDMGGSEKSLLAFKNKFRPQAFEEMVIFSVVKR